MFLVKAFLKSKYFLFFYIISKSPDGYLLLLFIHFCDLFGVVFCDDWALYFQSIG